MSKRQKSLSIHLPKQTQIKENLHLVIDSTGLKLFGEGEWKIRMHGKDKRRSWLKLHLAINTSNHDIEACVLTGDNVHDAEVLPELLKQVEHKTIAQVTGDGAYDTHDCYASTLTIGAVPCFPPRVNATRHKPLDKAWIARNHAVSHVLYKGLKSWKKKTHYHQRSLAETAMFRFKTLLGNRVSARTVETQVREIALKCKVLNRFNQLGMPLTEVA